MLPTPGAADAPSIPGGRSEMAALAFPPEVRVNADGNAAKMLGEAVLDGLAQGNEIQVLHLALHELEADGHDLPKVATIERVLASGTRLPESTAFSMANGDLFLIARRFTADSLRQLTALIAAKVPGMAPDAVSALCNIFKLPDDAIPLRKLIKAHLAGGPTNSRHASKGPGGGNPGADEVRARARASPPSAAASPASDQSDQPSSPVALEGPLTLDLLQHLRRLLDQIDVAPFIETQPVYGRGGPWRARYVEHFFDVARLHQAYFPSVDLRTDESLFVQFTRNLDDLMLVQVLGRRLARRGRIGLNLSTSTIHSPTFARISGHLSADERQNIVCELHWIEFLQDIQNGGGAVRCLGTHGYGLALDRISAAVLPYLDLTGSGVDFIKVPFDRATMAQIDPEIIAALKRCDPKKLVLTTCDDRKAVALGEALGIHNYQGRLIDQLARDRTA